MVNSINRTHIRFIYGTELFFTIPYFVNNHHLFNIYQLFLLFLMLKNKDLNLIRLHKNLKKYIFFVIFVFEILKGKQVKMVI
jgi:hypothetical protein